MPVLRIKGGQWRLNPVAVVVTVLAIVAMVKLGFWQIDRGQEKQAIIANHAQGMAEPATPVHSGNIDILATRTDRQVRATGRFRTGEYFLIDNQVFEGRVGYHVVALLEGVQFAPYLLPVNLGWVPLPGGRYHLPDIELPSSEVTIEGRVHIPAERPFLLNEQQFEDELPQRVQYLELDKLQQHLQMPLTQFSVLLDEEAEIGFARDWPVVVMDPHRHYAYAVQWFGLAIAALAVFLFASRVKSNKENNNHARN